MMCPPREAYATRTPSMARVSVWYVPLATTAAGRTSAAFDEANKINRYEE